MVTGASRSPRRQEGGVHSWGTTSETDLQDLSLAGTACERLEMLVGLPVSRSTGLERPNSILVLGMEEENCLKIHWAYPVSHTCLTIVFPSGQPASMAPYLVSSEPVSLTMTGSSGCWHVTSQNYRLVL